jgi:hypothetical protein
MPDEEHETIEEAIEAQAKGRVKSASEHGRNLQYMSIAELREAEAHLAAKQAARKPHFGLRMTKCIPPGGG